MFADDVINAEFSAAVPASPTLQADIGSFGQRYWVKTRGGA